jgi:hypothetical protein
LALEVVMVDFHAEEPEGAPELSEERGRGIVRARPPGGGDQLLFRRVETAEIVEVLASWALVDGRVELEADQILAGGKVDLERAKATDGDPLLETGGEPEVDESRRTDVQPPRSETERFADVGDGLGEELGQRAGLGVAICSWEPDDVDVGRSMNPSSRRLLPPTTRISAAWARSARRSPRVASASSRRSRSTPRR